jgi:hypothetical protein
MFFFFSPLDQTARYRIGFHFGLNQNQLEIGGRNPVNQNGQVISTKNFSWFVPIGAARDQNQTKRAFGFGFCPRDRDGSR